MARIATVHIDHAEPVEIPIAENQTMDSLVTWDEGFVTVQGEDKTLIVHRTRIVSIEISGG